MLPRQRTAFVSLGMLLTTLFFSAALLSAPPPKADNAQIGKAIRDGFFTTTDSARIHFRAAGQATARPPIFFLPGLTLSASLWDHELQTFSGDRLTVAVDSRSQGESSVMLSGNTPERRAVDLHELAENLHVSKFVVVGWSQGAQDVAAYIQQYGTDSLAAIVFVDSPISYAPADEGLSQAILGLMPTYEANPDHYESRIRSIFRKPHPELDLQHFIAEAKKTPPSIEVAMLFMDFFGADRRAALKKIDRPALVISSSVSPLLEAQKQMAQSIVGARWVVAEGAGHAVFLDAPEVFESNLKQLLEAAEK